MLRDVRPMIGCLCQEPDIMFQKQDAYAAPGFTRHPHNLYRRSPGCFPRVTRAAAVDIGRSVRTCSLRSPPKRPRGRLPASLAVIGPNEPAFSLARGRVPDPADAVHVRPYRRSAGKC